MRDTGSSRLISESLATYTRTNDAQGHFTHAPHVQDYNKHQSNVTSTPSTENSLLSPPKEKNATLNRSPKPSLPKTARLTARLAASVNRSPKV
jgi:hypothetical protein